MPQCSFRQSFSYEVFIFYLLLFYIVSISLLLNYQFFDFFIAPPCLSFLQVFFVSHMLLLPFPGETFSGDSIWWKYGGNGTLPIFQFINSNSNNKLKFSYKIRFFQFPTSKSRSKRYGLGFDHFHHKVIYKQCVPNNAFFKKNYFNVLHKL